MNHLFMGDSWLYFFPTHNYDMSQEIPVTVEMQERLALEFAKHCLAVSNPSVHNDIKLQGFISSYIEARARIQEIFPDQKATRTP
jgi:hypothetical protein